MGITDIAICGMGGELIAKIIDAAEFTKDKSIRLILQPMTKAEVLRGFLISNGFTIVGETLAKEDKVYQIICAEYTADVYEPTQRELFFGKINAQKGTAEFFRLLSYARGVYEQRIKGKIKADADCSFEQQMIEDIDAMLKGEAE